jgi:hypothetical protein
MLSAVGSMPAAAAAAATAASVGSRAWAAGVGGASCTPSVSMNVSVFIGRHTGMPDDMEL